MLAVLYFGLMELILMESELQLAQAERFRSRIVAATLAESAAELAAERFVLLPGEGKTFELKSADGSATGRLVKRSETNFELYGTATSAGVKPATATVSIQGRLAPVRIDWTEHSQ